MFDLARHHCASDTFGLEGFDEFGKLSQREPVNGGCALRFDFRKSFFFNRRDDDLVALRAGGVEDEEWKFSVAGNQAQFHKRWSVASPLYLITPRSDSSMKWI